jgi:hypothetical protein
MNTFRVNLQNKKETSKDDKYNFMKGTVCNNITSFSLSELLKQILDCKENPEHPLPEYHEYVFDNNHYHKLFLDIDYDCKYNEQYLEDNISCFKNEMVYILYDIIKKIKYFKIDIDKSINQKKQFIYDNIYITTSNNPNKTSLHVFFNQIFISTAAFTKIKKYIKKKTSNNELILNIDEAPFRKYTQLRLIYSTQSDKKNYYHTEYDFDIATKEDLSYFLITYVDVNKPHIKIDIDSVDNIGYEFDTENIYPHILYFNGLRFQNYLTKFLHKHEIYLTNDFSKCLKRMYNSELGKTIDISLNITKKCFCGKDTHKNMHFLKFTEEKILLLKYGNFANCKPVPLNYPNLTAYELTKFIKDLNIIKKLDNNEYIYWNKVKWTHIDDVYMYGGIILLVYETYKHNMLLEDRDFMANKLIKEKNIILSSISLYTVKQCEDPYMIQFNNGIYNIKTSTFYKGEDAKKYIKYNSIKTDFKDINEMSEKDLKEYKKYLKILINTFDLIIPPDHKCRNIFEANISSILHYVHKPIITILYGPTSGGKSTIKSLIRMLLSDMTIEIPIETFQYSNRKKTDPNAWLGKVEGKLVSFASEGAISANEKFIIKNIKQMTEKYIMGRELNSNKCEQKNTLTQLIDLNDKPVFNEYDTAGSKRLALIEINSTYFVDENLSSNIVNRIANNRNTVKLDKNFDQKILSGKFMIPLFNILVQWSNKYHMDSVNLLSTPHDFFELIKE